MRPGGCFNERADPLARARAYLPHMTIDQVFSHTTAALIHGLPLPWRPAQSLTVQVTTIEAALRRSGRGVVGHHVQPDRVRVVEVRSREGGRMAASEHPKQPSERSRESTRGDYAGRGNSVSRRSSVRAKRRVATPRSSEVRVGRCRAGRPRVYRRGP
jgi:hypothetical protein